jgi:hypothetical protein
MDIERNYPTYIPNRPAKYAEPRSPQTFRLPFNPTMTDKPSILLG